MWAIVPVVILAVAAVHRRPYFLMMVWTIIVLGVCLAPIAVWQFDSIRSRRRERRVRRSAERSVKLS
jgi:4-amino-4-deoxy-L-arabinose transferase-like glycosyltransferase